MCGCVCVCVCGWDLLFLRMWVDLAAWSVVPVPHGRLPLGCEDSGHFVQVPRRWDLNENGFGRKPAEFSFGNFN